MRFVETSVFLRVVTGNDPFKAGRCADFFRRLELRADEAATSEAIVAEVVFILSSRATYGLSREAIRARLSPYLRLRGLRLPGRSISLHALDLFVDDPALAFEDALSATHMEHIGVAEIVSYDRDCDRLPAVKRIEP